MSHATRGMRWMAASRQLSRQLIGPTDYFSLVIEHIQSIFFVQWLATLRCVAQ